MPPMTSSGPGPDQIARWKLVLAGLLLLTLLGSAAEFGTRVYLRMTSGYDGEHLYQFEFDPYKNILPTPNYVDTRGIRHNSKGFRRSQEVAVASPEGPYEFFLRGAPTPYVQGALCPHIEARYPVLQNPETI